MKLTIGENEKVVLQMQCSHFKGFMNIHQGTIYLTNERLIFARPNKAVRFWAPAVEGFVTGTDVSFAHPYTDFVSITTKRHGFAKKETITFQSGESYDIQAMDYDKFMSTLHELVAAANEGKVSDNGEGCFSVVR